jgi:hypothetical protein
MDSSLASRGCGAPFHFHPHPILFCFFTFPLKIFPFPPSVKTAFPCENDAQFFAQILCFVGEEIRIPEDIREKEDWIVSVNHFPYCE